MMNQPPSEPPDAAESFRASATKTYRVVRFCLPLVVLAGGWVGWHYWGWIGLAVGTVAGTLVAGFLFFAATIFWVLSQDGA